MPAAAGILSLRRPQQQWPRWTTIWYYSIRSSTTTTVCLIRPTLQGIRPLRGAKADPRLNQKFSQHHHRPCNRTLPRILSPEQTRHACTHAYIHCTRTNLLDGFSVFLRHLHSCLPLKDVRGDPIRDRNEMVYGRCSIHCTARTKKKVRATERGFHSLYPSLAQGSPTSPPCSSKKILKVCIVSSSIYQL